MMRNLKSNRRHLYLLCLLCTFAVSIALLVFIGFAATSSAQTTKAPNFVLLAKPYLQIGGKPSPTRMDVMWITRESDSGGSWLVEYLVGGKWKTAKTPLRRTMPFDPSICVYNAQLVDLKPGVGFEYKVSRDRTQIFTATGLGMKPASEKKYKFAVFGDCGSGTPGQKKIAFRVMKSEPALIVMPGDLVYMRGLVSEYLRNFYPIFNCDDIRQEIGAPIMRKIPTVGVIGNHDICAYSGYEKVNLAKYPDALGYFYLWSHPLNGPLSSKATSNVLTLQGPADCIESFKKTAGAAFPTTANFSFDFGNSHWLILDGNWYCNWTDAGLRKWVEKDLRESKQTWKFVSFHQPAFSCDHFHSTEQRMRLLCNIFQDTGVDIVFAGHAHNYQRTFPMKFKPKFNDLTPIIEPDGTVAGELALDKAYDGVKVSKPQGIIHIVTGAGGARLYNKSRFSDSRFLDKFIAGAHSFTLCDIDGDTLSVKQVDEEGVVIDRFKVSKR